MIKNIYLIRHGESNGNATGDYSTLAHDNLTKKGIAQAKQLAVEVENINPEMILCSPLSRAMQTIKPYLENTDRKATLLPFLSECCWQEDGDKTISNPPKVIDFEVAESDLAYFIKENDFDTIPSDDETWGDGYERVKKTFSWIQESDYESVAILTHGCFISILEAELLGLEPKVRKHLYNCSINCYSFDGNKFNHKIKNSISHLKK